MARWHEALDAVMRERGGRLTAYGSLLVGTAAAEDLVQDALIRAFSRGRDFGHVNAAEAYVRRVMATLSIDWHRAGVARTRREEASAGREVAAHEAGEIEASLDVRAALLGLAPRVRACLVLRYFDDLTVAQISEQLGLAPGTVKRYLHDGARSLGDMLGVDPEHTHEDEVLVSTAHEKGQP